MSKIWKIKPHESTDLIEQLFINREIRDKEKRDKFLNPKLSDYKNDLEIPGIKKSITRIKKAIENEELIIVYGDYDVDGICASAILYKGLTSLGAKVLPYIPHREKEGYGLSNIGLEFARDSGASVVITVDNGIVAIEQAKFAKSLGLDLIITDHHLPLNEKPEAYSIVHSTKMCGGAVAWCLIKDELSEKLRKELLQFVAIATVCDMIPLIGLGRAFLVEGLKELRRTDNPGLTELMRECGIDLSNIGSFEIGHVIGPRLNAIGRLEHAIDALRLLCTGNIKKARTLAKLLCDTNLDRQELTKTAVQEALLSISKDQDKKIYILHSPNWQPGIIGLVAARVAENYSRPAIVISVGEKISKGSARSVNGLNIVEAIRASSHLLVDVGGHSGAAGFSILKENIAEFIKKLEEYMVDVEMEDSVLEIDAEVEATKLSKSLVKEVEKLAPFGFGNPQPVLATFNMQVNDVRTVGSDGKHLKLTADNIDVIAFGMGALNKIIKPGDFIDTAYNLEINEFRGNQTLQLRAKDLRLSLSK